MAQRQQVGANYIFATVMPVPEKEEEKEDG
ncbi:hypothetical protein ACVIU4_005984 [Bradyrhizobium barranii subsp. barranii]